jgi:hypothetical protein
MIYKNNLMVVAASTFLVLQLLLPANQSQAKGFGTYNSNLKGQASPILSGQIKEQLPEQKKIIGPQLDDPTVINGVNTTGTVRVRGCGLTSLEILLNIFANGGEIFGVLFGGGIVFAAFARLLNGAKLIKAKIALGIFVIFAALAFPGIINWLIASLRDANFS